MSFRFPERDHARWLMPALLVCTLAACERERRDFSPPQGSATAPTARFSPLQPGGTQGDAPPGSVTMPSTPYRDEGNAYAVSQGKRLYRWYNCSACHAPGGGGDWGPPLSDAKWIYGDSPPNIFASIAQGRPNGMPSFGGHITEDQIWQLVAYVRSLSGQLPRDVAPNRADSLQSSPAESTRNRETPRIELPSDGAWQPGGSPK
jgi:cytochrome c oxidase cbb3-type subunit 3